MTAAETSPAAAAPAAAAPAAAAPAATAAVGLDVLRLSGVRATGNHGVFDHERRDGQEFVVDAVVHLDTRAAATGDDLEATVHYGVLAEQLVAAVESDPVDLIETLAERLAGVVLAFPAAVRTEITVHKPSAPITVPFSDVSITIVRERA
ncbi:dihydroneopterin aldolase [Frigoribacterium sp. CFBP9039]|uniref:dihydroneopterin aldolase n=1 Tax=Frigoribacterium sp. CFBP9029 TaxID=3096541 RepID=UPI002A69E36E|nr:dihydroneopterin aldolase [Frigoribacterium sp. CFBP9039]MDY0945879.1 dihydroneopterin aldolase [Frigoribacterium sp. CFBP9039]